MAFAPRPRWEARRRPLTTTATARRPHPGSSSRRAPPGHTRGTTTGFLADRRTGGSAAAAGWSSPTYPRASAIWRPVDGRDRTSTTTAARTRSPRPPGTSTARSSRAPRCTSWAARSRAAGSRATRTSSTLRRSDGGLWNPKPIHPRRSRRRPADRRRSINPTSNPDPRTSGSDGWNACWASTTTRSGLGLALTLNRRRRPRRSVDDSRRAPVTGSSLTAGACTRSAEGSR
mmetsp:Transcript_8959/g.36620  ORF Transcript_8959/g.36620 Transcript_8959/m.36620 type:complete len:231 (+) Transcript_8959:350-1042(+)